MKVCTDSRDSLFLQRNVIRQCHETEKKELTSKLEQQLDYQELEKIGNRISEITNLIDEKEMRWLELSENA